MRTERPAALAELKSPLRRVKPLEATIERAGDQNATRPGVACAAPPRRGRRSTRRHCGSGPRAGRRGSAGRKTRTAAGWCSPGTTAERGSRCAGPIATGEALELEVADVSGADPAPPCRGRSGLRSPGAAGSTRRRHAADALAALPRLRRSAARRRPRAGPASPAARRERGQADRRGGRAGPPDRRGTEGGAARRPAVVRPLRRRRQGDRAAHTLRRGDDRRQLEFRRWSTG